MITSVNDDQIIRVLAISPELPSETRPGSNAPLLRQIESLREAGVEVDVIDMRGVPMLKYLLSLPRMWSKLGKVDLVHGHFGFCGWLARMQWSKPLVISFMGDDLLGEPNDRGGLTRFSRFMTRANVILGRFARRVIVKSPEMADVLAPTQSFVIPNGVNIAAFQPMPMHDARERLGWDLDHRIILFPGDPENPRKGFALASAATSIVSEQLGESIHLQPMWGVSPEEIPLYMNASDAMWMTSSIEGSPNVVKEAMACNRHIVSVHVGDTMHMLRDVPGCRLVDERSASKLAHAMVELLQTGEPSGGRAAILERGLDLESVAQQVVDVYRLALGITNPNWQVVEKTHTRSSLLARVED
jgi:glycosyltransferase involved in cell wall biosynthesis